MNKSCQNKLEKILSGSNLNPNQKYLCKNALTGESIILNYKEASVYNYIMMAYRKYYSESQLGTGVRNNKLINKHINDYDKSREVFLFLNPTAYRLLVD